jgi:enamine deaminase RidA (YjgF/YER057c/UK114 family)
MMAGTVEKKLADLGITLGTPAAPVANYVGFVRTGNLLVVSGQLCFDAEGKLVAVGKLGGAVSIEDGQKAARLRDQSAGADQGRARRSRQGAARGAARRLHQLRRRISSTTPKVMNGASDLMVTAFGDKGRHARTTIGVAVLPLDAAVEVEGMFEVS